jgi:peptidyl-prolyl cis-trans isomerase C
MKKTLFLLLLSSFALSLYAQDKPAPAPASPAPAAAPAPVDPVAKVNGTPILRKDLELQKMILLEQAKRMGYQPSDKDLPLIEQEAVKSLIEMEVARQEAVKQGIKADPKELEKRYGEFKAQFKNPDEFQKYLKDMKYTEEKLKEETGKELMIYALMDKWSVGAPAITDADMKAFYDGNPDQFKHGERVKASHILIEVKDKANATAEVVAAAKKKAEGILAQLKGGADFAKLAAENSDDPGSKSRGGELGYFKKGQMVKEFEEAAFSTKPGELSGVVETKYGFHILKIAAHEGEGVVAFEETKPRLKNFMEVQKKRELVQQKLAELQKTSKIEKFLPAPPAPPQAAPAPPSAAAPQAAPAPPSTPTAPKPSH